MDFKLGRLKKLRVDFEASEDLNMDLNQAQDLDLSGVSFAGSDEGQDLGDFFAPKVGNYDYLDIDEEDLHTIPSPDLDASADPDLEDALLQDYEKQARGLGSTDRAYIEHHEHLREARQDPGPDPDIVLVEARKAMMGGVRGDALLHYLASKFDRAHLEAAGPELKSYVVDQHLLGNAILEPELFESCHDLKAFLKDRKVAKTAKLAKTCSDCQECPYRKKSHCQLFDATLVRDFPESEKIYKHYANHLRAAGKLPDKVAASALTQANTFKEATAAIFAWAENSPVLRREVEATLPNTALPERRLVAKTPRQALVETVGNMIKQGNQVDRVKSATTLYLGNVSFESVAKEALHKMGSAPWEIFGTCDHPLLVDNSVGFHLEAGPSCGGCVYNYGDHCHLNKRTFKQSFVDNSKYADTPDILSEDERMFLDATPRMDLSPSESAVKSLEPWEIKGLDEGFEV